MKKLNKKLRIAIVSDAVYPYNKGGKEKRIFELSTRLAKRGYDVTIYCMRWFKENERVENGVRLKAISPLYPLYSGQRRSIKQAIMFALSTFKLLREDFDVIDADHMPHLVLFPLKIVSILKRKRLFVTWNEVWGRKYWVEYMSNKSKILNTKSEINIKNQNSKFLNLLDMSYVLANFAYVIEWLSARLPDHIIAVSEHTKDKLVNDLGVKSDVISVVNNGIDLAEIKKVKPAREKSDVIYAGRLLSHKNVDVLIKSIGLLKKSYPNIKAIIVGEGPEEARLKHLTKNLKLEKNVVFYNFLESHDDLYALMKSSKVFVLPSTREGFGIAALEANACGVPFVTSNSKNNATTNLINGIGNGFAVSMEQKVWSRKLSEVLNRKINNKELINHVENFDWRILSNQIEEVYRV